MMTVSNDTRPTDTTGETKFLPTQTPTTNGMTHERLAEVLAFIDRVKDDKAYFESWEEQLAEVRQLEREREEREQEAGK